MADRPSPVPSFYLYGEPSRHVDPHFLHLETIAERSGPVAGRIRPHKHAELNHIFLFDSGSGVINIDGDSLDFSGPHLLLMPSGVVHGFTFDPSVTGYVLTLAGPYLRDLMLKRIGFADQGRSVGLFKLRERGVQQTLRRWILRLKKELVWRAPAQLAAIEANLVGLLIDIHRLSLSQSRESDKPGHLKLMARFHALVEISFRHPRSLSTYLEELKVTETQLRYACERAGNGPPAQIILSRRLIEARRTLIYSDLSVSECALSLGFDDPAYFSRLFAKYAGMSPKAYRAANRS